MHNHIGGIFLRFSACIEMLYSNMEFYDRFNAAKQNGFDTVEFWKWSNKDIDGIKQKMIENNLSCSVFNIDSRNSKLSDDLSHGVLNSGRKNDLIRALEESIPVYNSLGASGMIVLIGETLDISYEKQINNIIDCLLSVKPIVEKENVTLVVEPLNNFDRKNYFLPRSKEVIEIIRKVNSPNIKLLLDLYHEQLMAGNLIGTVADNIDIIGHIHVADAPGRHEPGTGEINYGNVLKSVNDTYGGYVGLEFRANNYNSQNSEYIRRIIE